MHVRCIRSPSASPNRTTDYTIVLLQVGNHEAVTKFALRGCGSPGSRPVSAPLADPSAKPGLDHYAAADAAMRHVAHALLAGVEAKQVSQEALQVGDMQEWEQGRVAGKVWQSQVPRVTAPWPLP
jgi:hypothetical protein